MACAKCSFYVPKESSRAQLLEAKANLQRMKREIPLQEERAAVEDGLIAVERLYERLIDVPTPAGPTPRELKQRNSEDQQNGKPKVKEKAKRLYPVTDR